MSKISTSSHSFKRDLFEIENARNLTTEELVETFVPTANFWKLVSAKNHIILGSRGSGKTALAKMLSHNHLAKLNNSLAKSMIDAKSFIGLYVSTKTEWTGALKNKPWQNEVENELFFQSRLNLSSCISFLITLQSCLNVYHKDIAARSKLERKIITILSDEWSMSSVQCATIRELEGYVDNIAFAKSLEIAKKRALGSSYEAEPLGIYFDTDLFTPLKRAIKIASEILEISKETAWLLCIDEAENLSPEYHKILNSYLRSDSENLFFKITTMPYCHYTLETNIGVPVNVGHDFEYVYIDQDKNLIQLNRSGKHPVSLVENIFLKRAKVSGKKYEGITLDNLLGPSKLLDFQEWDFSDESEDMRLFKKYASDITQKRAFETLNSTTGAKSFKDQFGRKMRGMLLLRDSIENLKGKKSLDVYSGVSMAVMCGDANPRRLIRIFNSFLKNFKWEGFEKNRPKVPIIDAAEQTRILTSFAYNQLSRFQSEEQVGPELYRFINQLGNFMSASLHTQPLGTEQISSIEIDDKVMDKIWILIKKAVGLGLLYHNVNLNNPDQMPEKDGTFHLAYVLAPHFKLLPRRGDSRKWNTILSFGNRNLFN